MAESVAKGGGALVAARMVGMLFSFLLFLVLARHSVIEAGTFRTILTYLIISESLGMLGMQRWLTVEIASNQENRWRLFLATSTVMLVVSITLSILYAVISYAGFYGDDLNQGLRLAVLAVIPTGIYQCIQSVWVGEGKNGLLSKYNAIEYIVRCAIGIALIYLGYSVIYVILVFVVMRWVMALYALACIGEHLQRDTWRPDAAEMRHVLHDAPKFVTIIVAFLLLRNSALVLIPAIIDEAETAFYAVAYQLFDLILLIPSVLAITSNRMFVDKAEQSVVALKRVSTQLLSLFSIVMFPCIAVTLVFAPNFLHALYGQDYLRSAPVLMFLMIASGFAMLDMVLSQIMMARKDYKNDMMSVVIGGGVAVVLTTALTYSYGATGAAAALMIALLVTVLSRMKMLSVLFPAKLFLTSLWRPVVAACLSFGVAYSAVHQLDMLSSVQTSKFLWIAFVPLVLGIYIVFLYLLGGINIAKRSRLRKFLFH